MDQREFNGRVVSTLEQMMGGLEQARQMLPQLAGLAPQIMAGRAHVHELRMAVTEGMTPEPDMLADVSLVEPKPMHRSPSPRKRRLSRASEEPQPDHTEPAPMPPGEPSHTPTD